jgi:hypothetical protein
MRTGNHLQHVHSYIGDFAATSSISRNRGERGKIKASKNLPVPATTEIDGNQRKTLENIYKLYLSLIIWWLDG